MIQYILIGLLILGMILTMYQLYLSNSWTTMIKRKQEQYTNAPSIKSNQKALYHRMELCTLALACVLFVPPQMLQKNNSVAPEFILDDGDAISYQLKNESDMEIAPQKANPLSSTNHNTNRELSKSSPDSISLITMLSNQQELVTVSLEMVDTNARVLDSATFLELYANQEILISKQTSLETCDYIVLISSKDISERELLFKEEEKEYLLCDSMDEICYALSK